jgi:RNA polymerase sigma-70 factor (ECF subfamily)
VEIAAKPGGSEFGSDRSIEGSRADPLRSFEELVTQYEKRIFGFLFHLSRNKHDAEDLTQETFLKAYHNFHRYDSRYPFAPWLFTIAKRTALNHFRDTKPMEELPAESEFQGENPAVVLERKDATDSIWSLARKLKPNQFEALWLRYAEGFSVAETARVMGTNQIHVKVLLHRARNQLAKSLTRAGFGSPLTSKP